MARKILLADDSVTAQNMGRKILTDAGYEVTTVNNGSAALKKIAEQLPELIVLDVYMPGYSGLEVCQRLKETRETARIPVLLTVGKLEPFKPEDARKAKADAYVIKPFEASELLTALTRLEDKIVPKPASQKGGAFAKTWSSLEQGGDPEKFGDADSGWKDRLSMPPATPKREEEPAEAADAKADKKGKKKEKEKEAEPAPPPVPVAAGVPQDITPEEVAAIAAAAAAFEEKAQPAPAEFAVESAPVPEEEAAPVAAPAVSAEAPAAVEAKVPEVKVEEPKVESKAEEPKPEIKEEPAPAPEAAAVSAVDSKAEASAEEKATQPPVAEVAASKPNGKYPRWIAEEVPLAAAETAVLLEQEMRRTNTLLQAAAGPVDFGATPAPPPVVESVKAEPAAEIKTAPEKPEAAEAASAAEPAVTTAVATQTVAEPEPVAAAAAASAGSSTIEAIVETKVSESLPEPAPEPDLPRDTPMPASLREKSQSEADLAAAWAQWKQVRESVVGPQLVSQVSEAAAAELEKHVPAEPQSAPAGPPGNPTAIANLVDSVLAELKPKLVEEIAKKLGKEKE